MIVGNRDWLQPTTFAEAVDATLPLGKVYLPDCVVPRDDRVGPAARRSWSSCKHAPEARPRGTRRPTGSGRSSGPAGSGGTSRRSTPRATRCTPGCSASRDRLAAARGRPPRPTPITSTSPARSSTGASATAPTGTAAFGGLYLPHLRNAIYRHLIAAHNALDEAEGRTGPRVSLEVADFNLDARQEVRLENDRLIAFVRPAPGGHVYELDVRHAADQRPGHARPPPRGLPRRDRRGGAARDAGRRPPFTPDRVVLKQEGLDQLLVYDRHPRKALVDHFFPLDVTPRRPRSPAATSSAATSPRGPTSRRSSAAPSRVALVDGAARPGRRPRDPGPQDDRAGGRQPDPGRRLRPGRPARGRPAPFRRRDQPRRRWPGTPTTAIIPTPTGDRLGMLDARLDLADGRRA